MNYTIKWTSRFKNEYKLLIKRGEDIQALDNVIRLLANGVKLPPEYHDHILSGRYAGLHECHIHRDLLLIFDPYEGVIVVTLFRSGSHSDLFQVTFFLLHGGVVCQKHRNVGLCPVQEGQEVTQKKKREIGFTGVSLYTNLLYFV